MDMKVSVWVESDHMAGEPLKYAVTKHALDCCTHCVFPIGSACARFALSLVRSAFLEQLLCQMNFSGRTTHPCSIKMINVAEKFMLCISLCHG